MTKDVAHGPLEGNGKPEDHGPKVHFEHVGAEETVEFHASWDATLQALWDEALGLLEEPKRPDDHLQSLKGTDLTPHLGATLRQLVDGHVITGFKVQIVGPHGGAAR